MIYVVIGVCGSGKTTIGRDLARMLACEFTEGDDYHSTTNKEKMSKGIPLNDEDRLPWLLSLHDVIKGWQNENKEGVVACSALKRSYRNILRFGTEQIPSSVEKAVQLQFVHLTGSRDLLMSRMTSREGHFMPVKLLDSQMQILEKPTPDECHITIDIDDSPRHMVETILTNR